ncbi:MAG: ABC transporter permease, partial [Dokdonella sp.]
DKIPLQSQIFPNKEGSKNWNFNLVGVMKSKDSKAFQSQMIILHWKNFDETTPYNRGSVGWYISRVVDMNQSDRVAKAIDVLSANSDHETKTQTEQAATANWIKQMADIGLIVTSIMGAVFFTLVLLTGNTMMQAVRERTSELAVLKTIGFSSHSVLAMVLAESVLLLLLGGLIGLGLVSLIGLFLPAMSGGMITHTHVGIKSWSLGVVLAVAIGVVVGALPAMRAMRLNIVDALAGR